MIVKVKIEVVSFETESGRKRTIGVVKFDVNDANSLVRGHMWYHNFGSNTTGATNGAGTAYPPQTPAFSHACLSFFDLRILITPKVSPNSSLEEHLYMYFPY